MSITIALDAMGGDRAPDVVVEGAARALRERADLRFLVFGDEARVGQLLARHDALAERSELRHTDQFVANDTKPAQALRQARRSSMRLSVEAVKAGEADAAVSAGNTGALMAIAKIVLRTLPGIDRPAICTVLPGRRPVVMLDLGANVGCSAEHLVQFAVMGEVYARAVLGLGRPKVALLNVGTEDIKGEDVVRKAARMLRASPLEMEFVGYVEGNDIVHGVVDVVVTDGFTGNVALKMAEGASRLYGDTLKEAFGSSLRAKLGYLLARPALAAVRERYDPRRYNGAMLIGLNGIVVKSHGGTDALGFAHAVLSAARLVEGRTNERIGQELQALADGLAAAPRVAAS